jgi:hypothetical protein
MEQSMKDDSGATILPAYVPFHSFLTVIDKLETGGMATRVDRGYWGSFMAGGRGMILMSALRFLGLITRTAEPTPELERLVDRATRKATLAEVLRARYAIIFEKADPARSTRQHLERAFKDHFKVDGETRRKAIAFFVKASEYAGLPLSSYLGTRTAPLRTTVRQSAAARPRKAGKAVDAAAHSPNGATNGVPVGGDSRTVTLPGGNGTVTLTARVNWLTLPPRQRERLYGLIDALTELERDRSLPPAGGTSAPDASS